jgi:DNA-binding MarR family transcriptional regulator
MVEHIHRLFLDVLKIELEKIGVIDISNVQSLVLYNIGEEVLTVGELTSRGYYLGTNVSYNLRKMVQYNYVEQIQSDHDKRSSYVKLSPKGLDLYKQLDKIFQKHSASLKTNANIDDLKEFMDTLKTFEKYWNSFIYQIYPHK